MAFPSTPLTAAVPGTEPEKAGFGRKLAGMPTWAGATIGVVLILIVWTVLAETLFRASGSIPTPWSVAAVFPKNGFGLYWTNASVTVWSAVQGFIWGNLVAIALSMTVLMMPRLEGVITQVAVISYCIPLTAIGPVVLIISNPGSRTTSIFLAAMSCFFTTVVGCLLGFRSADRSALDLVRAYGGGKWMQLRKVQLIAALPSLFAALKIAAPAALLGAVLGEYFGGVDSGLGVAITSAQTNVNVPQLWALALLSGAIAGVWYVLIGLIGRFLMPWSTTVSKRGGR